MGLSDLFTGGGDKLIGKAVGAYQKRKKKRDREKMDTSIATSDENGGGPKRPSAKRSDDWS